MDIKHIVRFTLFLVALSPVGFAYGSTWYQVVPGPYSAPYGYTAPYGYYQYGPGYYAPPGYYEPPYPYRGYSYFNNEEEREHLRARHEREERREHREHQEHEEHEHH